MKPERILVHWGFVSENGRGPYLSGREDHGGTRTSTPLVELDLEAGTALTASDRPYRLIGKPDPDYALLVARSVWGQYFDLTGSTIEALSPADAKAMVAWRRNEPITPEERAAFAKKTGIPIEPEDITPWGSGDVFRDLGIPDPEEGEDDDMPGYVGVVPEVKSSLILSIRDAMRRKGLTLPEAAWIAGVEPRVFRAVVEDRRVHDVSAEALDRILQSIDDWQPMRNDF